MLLFLSYADEDGEIGREIAERLRSEDVSVYAPRDGGDSAPAGDHMAGRGGPPPPPEPHFRNRDEELNEVCDGVRKDHGERFWLLIASPQHGKTWLLKQIAGQVQRESAGRWVVRLVDSRDLPAEIAGDADAILRMMFGLWPPDRPGPVDVHGIAASISDNGRFQLCLLDSAELLEESTVRRLRHYLSEINAGVASSSNARLAVIAASRRDRGWKGLDPARAPQIRRLTEFSDRVIQDALARQARNMGRSVTGDELRQLAAGVQRLSEGLPALLARCLRWLREQNWREPQRLSDQDTFYEIATPYVEDDLLSPGSLRGSGPKVTEEQQGAIREALRALCPYRLFTGSHLSDLARRGELHDALLAAGWSAEDLWTAVSRTDLLYPSERGAWLTIDPPIRRLLCRYWYPSEADRGRANREACAFLEPFAVKQAGSDQAAMLVECLWHEAQALILERSTELEPRLTGLASELSARLTPNRSFNVADLREYAARRITEDDPELAEALRSVPGLLGRLAEAVRQPAQERS